MELFWNKTLIIYKHEIELRCIKWNKHGGGSDLLIQ